MPDRACTTDRSPRFLPRRICAATEVIFIGGIPKVSILLDIRWPGGAFWTNIRGAWSRIQRDFSAETVGQSLGERRSDVLDRCSRCRL